MLNIAGFGRHVGTLGTAPDDLRAQLQALGVSVRRVNRFIELALLGALRCRERSGDIGTDAALYVAAETPMLNDCVKALRSTIAEQRPPTPFEFMNISGNMAGFYIAQQLGIGGPQLAVARRHGGLEAGIELLGIGHRSHRRALLGCVDEGVWPLDEQRDRLGLAADTPLHESSHWFHIDADCAAPLARVAALLPQADYGAIETCLRALPGGTRLALHPRLERDAPPLPATLERLPGHGLHGQGACAEALYRYLDSGAPAPWCHLSRGEDGLWYLLHVQPGAG
ncbi:hypothetical protein [Solimonas flava]|uniref:hypothetical protein n=1 Tax=Solimonas flava TaxID=415849 RepID=UPI0003F7CF99|nr:hypothetical protein [Solimonas flava]